MLCTRSRLISSLCGRASKFGYGESAIPMPGRSQPCASSFMATRLIQLAHAEPGVLVAAPGIAADHGGFRARQMYAAVRTAHHRFRIAVWCCARRGPIRRCGGCFRSSGGLAVGQNPCHHEPAEDHHNPENHFAHVIPFAVSLRGRSDCLCRQARQKQSLRACNAGRSAHAIRAGGDQAGARQTSPRTAV